MPSLNTRSDSERLLHHPLGAAREPPTPPVAPDLSGQRDELPLEIHSKTSALGWQRGSQGEDRLAKLDQGPVVGVQPKLAVGGLGDGERPRADESDALREFIGAPALLCLRLSALPQ